MAITMVYWDSRLFVTGPNLHLDPWWKDFPPVLQLAYVVTLPPTTLLVSSKSKIAHALGNAHHDRNLLMEKTQVLAA
jgi:hypothetical protein